MSEQVGYKQMIGVNANEGKVEYGSPKSQISAASKDSLGPQGDKLNKLREQFVELVSKDIDDQMEFFLKSFIFALGDEWKQVSALCDEFKIYLQEKLEKEDLDAAQAADFLQRKGRTRTALQRREELADIDLDNNDRICFTEYLLLHFKILILNEYFKRNEIAPTVSLENDGVGLTGVGTMLLEELFTLPLGMDPALEAAIEDFMAKKKARESQMNALREKTKLGGVKGLTAKTELMGLENQDLTDMNRIEITLNAAKKRASKESGPAALAKKREQEEKQAEAARLASRQKLKERANLFEGK